MTAPVAYLLDTNVISETRKKPPDPRVLAFLQMADSSTLFLSVLTIGELRRGIQEKRRNDAFAAKSLAAWAQGLEVGFANQILGIDAATARLWGEWSADRPRSVIDTLLAATAAVHDLTFVTRNLRHVQDLPIRILSPWV
jgi:hypothetical protein